LSTKREEEIDSQDEAEEEEEEEFRLKQEAEEWSERSSTKYERAPLREKRKDMMK
jgi:hypothetical protein